MRTDSQLPSLEFVALMAWMMALVALCIDAMLPALSIIGRDLQVANPNDSQLIVSMVFIGLAFGQMIYGPLSDTTGRKPSVYFGFALFIVGCLLSIFAKSLATMLVGRVIQGLGLAGPRVVSVALIRDQFEGRAMARVMSLVMAVFILVPIVAPALGQAVLAVAPWQAIFGTFIFLTFGLWVWFYFRQPETLAPADRRPFSLSGVWSAVLEILGLRAALGYTLAAGWISGAFLGYLSTAQQVFQQQYGLGDRFPLFFAVLALFVGGAALVNAKLVMQFGMSRLSMGAVHALVVLSATMTIWAWTHGPGVPLWQWMTYLCSALFCIGILFGNLNSLALEPLGHIAGIGAAVVGSLVTFLSVPVGIAVGHAYDGTVLPLAAGFTVCALLTQGTMWWCRGAAEHRHSS